MIRIGKISTIDKDNGMASVVYEDEEDSTTGMMPIVVPFTKGAKFDPPTVGQYVVVAYVSSTDGMIIGSYFNEDNPPEE